MLGLVFGLWAPMAYFGGWFVFKRYMFLGSTHKDWQLCFSMSWPIQAPNIFEHARTYTRTHPRKSDMGGGTCPPKNERKKQSIIDLSSCSFCLNFVNWSPLGQSILLKFNSKKFIIKDPYYLLLLLILMILLFSSSLL